MKTVTIKFNDKTEVVVSNDNDNLLEVLRKNNINITSDCGGNGKCKKCQVEFNNNKILSCQTIVDKDMEIKINKLSNNVKFINDNEFFNNYNNNSKYGIAIDIGTTTLAYYLINLEDKIEVDYISEINKQKAYGADIISRIKSCSDGNLNILNNIIINQINNTINYFQRKYLIKEMEKIITSANTTMLHILVNVDPTSLGVYQYRPVFVDKKELNGEEINIRAKKVILLPSISSFIGGDIVSGLLSCNKFDNFLFIDIGTNGEIVLKRNNKMYGCSTAAGPAFEGINIEFGMGAVSGAITKIKNIGNKLRLETINDEPTGLCGSALLDIISILLEENLIDENGSFSNTTNSIFKENLLLDKFYITKKIYITQKDIREFQLAKSAIRSGIEAIVNESCLEMESISKVFIAGGFGFHINILNAIKVGLFPESFKNKISILGNASGIGAKMCLLNSELLNDCDLISKCVKVIELSNNSYFRRLFIENLTF